MAFQLIGGHPALDLVNTLDWRFRKEGPEDLLNSYDDLLRFTEQAELLTPEQTRRLRRTVNERLGARTLQRCRGLREALAEMFYAPSAAAVKTLGGYFQAARLQQKLAWKDSRLEWNWASMESAELPLWVLALSASELATSDAMDRVRECGNPECRWLFLDSSKNHTRRWCDMKVCGNRMKARRFKAHKRN